MDLKRILNLKRDEVCGLDIGSSAVKIVAMRKDDTGYEVIAAGISQIADRRNSLQGQNTGHGGIDTNTVKAAHDCFVSTKLNAEKKPMTNLAVCGVSGPEIAVRDFEFPPLQGEEIDGAVSLEAELVWQKQIMLRRKRSRRFYSVVYRAGSPSLTNIWKQPVTN